MCIYKYIYAMSPPAMRRRGVVTYVYSMFDIAMHNIMRYENVVTREFNIATNEEELHIAHMYTAREHT